MSYQTRKINTYFSTNSSKRVKETESEDNIELDIDECSIQKDDEINSSK